MTQDELQSELFKIAIDLKRSELREQQHKEAKAAAEAQTARAFAEAAERHVQALDIPKVTIGGKS